MLNVIWIYIILDLQLWSMETRFRLYKPQTFLYSGFYGSNRSQMWFYYVQIPGFPLNSFWARRTIDFNFFAGSSAQILAWPGRDPGSGPPEPEQGPSHRQQWWFRVGNSSKCHQMFIKCSYNYLEFRQTVLRAPWKLRIHFFTPLRFRVNILFFVVYIINNMRKCRYQLYIGPDQLYIGPYTTTAGPQITMFIYLWIHI